MRAYVRKKLEHLHGQPEHVRVRTAVLITVIVGVILILGWLLVLLPLQLFLLSDRKMDEPQQAQQEQQ